MSTDQISAHSKGIGMGSVHRLVGNGGGDNTVWSALVEQLSHSVLTQTTPMQENWQCFLQVGRDYFGLVAVGLIQLVCPC